MSEVLQRLRNKVYYLRNTRLVPLLRYCDRNTRVVARLEKSIKNHEPLGECFQLLEGRSQYANAGIHLVFLL